MGYESKIFIVNVISAKDFRYADEIATVDMSKMGYGNGWRELFKSPIDFKVWYRGEEIDTDCYDEHLKSADYNDVIVWLKNYMRDNEYYRRVPVLLGILNGINPNDWDNLKIVHYGY